MGRARSLNIASAQSCKWSTQWRLNSLLSLNWLAILGYELVLHNKMTKVKGFWTIVFIFMVISTMFWAICPPAFLRCLSNSRTFMELWTTSLIKDVVQSSVKVPEFSWNIVEITIKMKTIVQKPLMIIIIKLRVRNLDNKHLKKAGGYIGWNIVEITIKMKTIVQKPLMIIIIKLRLRNWLKLICDCDSLIVMVISVYIYIYIYMCK